MNKKYELHDLEDRNLPIIFHYDIATKKSGASSSSLYYGYANWHNNIELLYCAKGKGTVICNGEEHSVEKGDIIVINSNMLHSASTTDSFEYYCLIIDSGFLSENGIETDKTEYKCLIKSETAQAIYTRLINEIVSDNKYRIAAIRSAVLELMLFLSRNCLAEQAAYEKNRIHSDEYIKLAIGYIKANISQRLTLEDTAREVGLSKFHFSREFKKATGMTFVSFVNAIRCHNAKKLLSGKKYSIHETALRCGFENDSYFSKTFKSVTGFLPSEYIKIPKTDDYGSFNVLYT